LIVHAEDRKSAIARMKRALKEFVIEGIKTTIPFHLKVLNHRDFQKGEYCTKFIEEKLSAGVIVKDIEATKSRAGDGLPSGVP